MYVLLEDDLGRLTLRRLRPWHRLLARGRATRLDRELAAGTRPEANASLAARAARLTSAGYRRDLAASLLRMLAAAGESAAVMQAAAAPRPRSYGGPIPGGPARPDARHLAGPRDRLEAAPAAHSSRGATRSPRVPLRLARISQSAPLLAELASRLVEPGPVPVQGVAMVSQLLANGTGPLYNQACRDDLGYLVEQATHALAR
jgi:hypothetical protein